MFVGSDQHGLFYERMRMMAHWQQYLYSVIATSLCCAIVVRLLTGTKRKERMRLICGVIMAMTILRPLTDIDLEQVLQMPVQDLDCGESYIAEGEQAAAEALQTGIKASCEAYILDKAKALGMEIRPRVLLDEKMVPVSVRISGKADTKAQRILQEILTMDLGIPKENQEWIWNQENSNSLLP